MSSRTSFIGLLIAIVVAVAAVTVAVFVVVRDVNRPEAAPASSTSSTARVTTAEASDTSETTTEAQDTTDEQETTTDETQDEATTAPSSAQPTEGQPCGPEDYGRVSDDGTLVCTAVGEGAWRDRTNQSRPAVVGGSPCDEPGARARVAGTDGIARCQPGPDGTLIWDY